jgi:Domain of unknown function (DUF4189)
VIARICSLSIILVLAISTVNAGHAAGAYAIGKSGGSSWGGGVTNAANYAVAEQEALGRCGKYGPGCAVAVYFSRKCFSLAIPPHTGTYYWATRDTIEQASATAMQNCQSSGRFCEVKAALCDVNGVAAQQPQPNVRATPLVVPATPRFQPGIIDDRELALPAIKWPFFLLVGLGALALVAGTTAFRRQSFDAESGYSTRSAEDYDREAGRFRAMSRKLDAETELAESVIKAKRTRAELEDIEQMFGN